MLGLVSKTKGGKAVIVTLVVLAFALVTKTYFFQTSTNAKVTVSDAVSEKAKAIKRRYSIVDIRRRYDSYVLSADMEKALMQQRTGAVPAVLYHGIPLKSSNDAQEVPRTLFMEHMFALKKAGFHALTIDQFRDEMSGKTPIDNRGVLITFDDGVRTSFENTDDIFEALDLHAVMFDISGYSLEGDNHYYLHAEDLKAMTASGRWDVEAHTHASHVRVDVDGRGTLAPILANRIWLPAKSRLETATEYVTRVDADLAESKRQLSDFTGRDVYAFAVPYNDHGQTSSNVTDAAHVLPNIIWRYYDMRFDQLRFGLSGEFRGNYPNKAVKRVYLRLTMGESVTTDELVRSLAASYVKSLPYEEDFGNPHDWVDPWGDRVPVSGGFTLRTSEKADSYLGYLDGSKLWSNYEMTVKADLKSAKTFSLSANVEDAYRHVDCTFDRGGTVQLIGESSRAAEGVSLSERVPLHGSVFGENTFGMKVAEGTATCLFDGKPVVSAMLPASMPHMGGIGLQVWDPAGEDANVLVHGISVVPNK